MRKTFRMILSILIVIMGIFSLVSSAQASFWIAGIGAYYSPNYGDIGDRIDRINRDYGAQLKLEAGLGFGFSTGYDFEKWGLRLDGFTFEAETSSIGYIYSYWLSIPVNFRIRTSITPIILSAVYRVPTQSKLHPYLGAGVGKFFSEMTYTYGALGLEGEQSESDSPIGFQILGGAEYRLENRFFVCGELRYLSAETDYPTFVNTDWSGVFASIGVGLKF